MFIMNRVETLRQQFLAKTAAEKAEKKAKTAGKNGKNKQKFILIKRIKNNEKDEKIT